MLSVPFRPDLYPPSLQEMKEMSTKSARKTLSEHYKALILFELGQYLGVYSKSTKLAHVNLVLYPLLHLTSRVGQRRKKSNYRIVDAYFYEYISTGYL